MLITVKIIVPDGDYCYNVWNRKCRYLNDKEYCKIFFEPIDENEKCTKCKRAKGE